MTDEELRHKLRTEAAHCATVPPSLSIRPYAAHLREHLKRLDEEHGRSYGDAWLIDERARFLNVARPLNPHPGRAHNIWHRIMGTAF